ncbi:MAG: hypothetical protein N3H31_01655 [Candidatus Nezhaarchaeota archaeon]|nr:hypothetical protein [Candidatus Nezhaarchaeota archaeon]
MLREVKVSSEALKELAKRGVKAVRIRLVSEVQEWTMCCVGSACVISQKAVVEEGRGEGARFEVGGVEVYVSEDVSSRAKEAIELVLEQGELRVRGVEVEDIYTIKPASTSELPEWT